MNKKTIIKIITLVFVIMVIYFLAKTNIKMEKEKPISKDEQSGVATTHLDVTSPVLKELLDNSSIDLINSNVSNESFLLSDSYSFMYFNFEGQEKKLESDEKLYVALNKLYQDGKYIDKKGNAVFEKAKVYEMIESLYGKQEFEKESEKFKNSECGIKQVFFRENEYEVQIDKCQMIRKVGYYNIYDAYKESDNIRVYLDALYIEGDLSESSNSDITLYNYNHEKLNIVSYENLDTEIKKAYKDERISKYKFNYKLMQDKYYLVSIEKI